MSEGEDRYEEGSKRAIHLSWQVLEGVPAEFADRMLLQQCSDGDLIMVSLFQTAPPIILKPSDAEQLEEIKTYCVGRFILTPKKAKELSEILIMHLTKHFPTAIETGDKS